MTIDTLGIDRPIDQENSSGPQMVAQPWRTQPPSAAERALPLEGNLRYDALLPVVVPAHPLRMTAAIYTPPLPQGARGRSNPLTARMLRGRSGS